MKIEQLLHGYDNGHRLLAGSVLLKSNMEMDAVATLSDWSEYVAPGGGESSYVTAYPLLESGYYVVAKTWYADEMKRPGCVWTHSLLIPFDTLNHLDDFKRLACLFKRPSLDGSLDEYSRTIEYENKNYSADDYPIWAILFKNIDEIADSGVLYFFAGEVKAPQEGSMCGVNWLEGDYDEDNDTGWRILTIDLSQSSMWNGIINGYRLTIGDRNDLNGQSADIKWIGNFKTVEEAYTYAGMKDLYDKNKKIKRLENMYFSIIAIPALTQCLSELQKPDNSVGALCLDYRWFSSFKKQYEAINENELTDEAFLKMNAMVEAQKILNTPTTKSIDDIFNMFVMKEDIGGTEND